MGKFWVGSKFKRSLDPTIRKETGKKKFWCHLARIVAVKGKERNEKKLKKLKSKDKDKQWSHTMGKKSQGENAKKYGDSKNCWEGI